MKHTFRVNVHGKGYTLLCGNSMSDCREYPLDIEAEPISANYLAAQKEIDNMITFPITRWHICIANVDRGSHPVVAYGSLLPFTDDRSRAGISIIHALECNDVISIDAIVLGVVQLLQSSRINELKRLLANLAQEAIGPDRVTDMFFSHFSNTERGSPYAAYSTERPIKEFRHDCGGAVAVAWLAMAMSHRRVPPPWTIYERYSNVDGVVSTLSSCNESKGTFDLSEYINTLTRDHLNSSEVRREREFPVGTLYGDVSPQCDASSALHERWPTQHGQQAGWSRSAGLPRRGESPMTSDHRISKVQCEALVVRLKEVCGLEIVVTSGRKQFRVLKENCRSVTNLDDCFEFVIVKKKLMGWRETETRLVLLKRTLSPSQISDVEFVSTSLS